MAHVHTQPGQLDLVNAVFVVHPTDQRVLLVKHKKLGGWFAPGGHVELHETADEALARELREETGLVLGADCFVWQTRQQTVRRHVWLSLGAGGRNHDAAPQYVPWMLEVHNFLPLEDHRHMALVYLARAATGSVALEAAAHDAIKWFSLADLHDPAYGLLDTIRLYGVDAILHYYEDAVLGAGGP